MKHYRKVTFLKNKIKDAKSGGHASLNRTARHFSRNASQARVDYRG